MQTLRLSSSMTPLVPRASIKRPLSQILITPTHPVLNHFLDELVKFRRSPRDPEQKAFCAEIPPDWDTWVQEIRTGGCLKDKILVILYFMTINRWYREGLLASEPPAKAYYFANLLDQQMDYYVMGLEINGSNYSQADRLVMHSTGHLVCVMVRFYARL
jgi:hypothetical protein